jgi:hypothetical protein
MYIGFLFLELSVRLNSVETKLKGEPGLIVAFNLAGKLGCRFSSSDFTDDGNFVGSSRSELMWGLDVSLLALVTISAPSPGTFIFS